MSPSSVHAGSFRSPSALLLLLLLTLCLTLHQVHGFHYIPGASPTYYKKGDKIKFDVNSLRSNIVTFPLRYDSLPFCQTANPEYKKESIGEIIFGDHLMSSPYSAKMLENSTCLKLECANSNELKEIGSNQKMLKKLNSSIENEYRVTLSIDNLPTFLAEFPYSRPFTCTDKKKEERIQEYLFTNKRGYPIGIPAHCGESTVVFNHLYVTIKYNTKNNVPLPATEEEEKNMEYMVVGLTATPASLKWSSSEEVCSSIEVADEDLTMEDIRLGKANLTWSYSIKWEKSDVMWASRWDAYLNSSYTNSNASLHYSYGCVSVITVVFTAVLALIVLSRALHRDFNRYNSQDPEDLQEETGWKLIHADVFRPPDRAYLLAALAGSGYQVIGMCTGAFILALFGLLSPSRRGTLITSILFLAVFMAVLGGYVCGKLLKYLNCQAWKHVLLCAFAVPGAVCGTIIFVDLINTIKGAATSLPFSVIISIFALWLFVSVPLTVIGAIIAFRQGVIENPLPVGRLAREIPYYGCVQNYLYYLTVTPIIPFCTILMELYFVMEGVWAGEVFYAFGFLSFAGFLWFVVCALITVFSLYYVLCYENHRWWWIAFIIPGGFGIHIFLFAIYYFKAKLLITSFSSALLYFTYMGLISVLYGIAAGAIGLTAGIIFVRTIYANIKVD